MLPPGMTRQENRAGDPYDEEVPALAERALSENLSRADIKKLIKNWQLDSWRV